MGIFSPVSINGLALPNHLALAPINTGYFLNGHIQPACFEFYRRRSGSVGTVYVGNAAIAPDLATNPRTAYFSPDNRAEWVELAKTIRRQGSVPAIQLGCRYSKIPAMREWVNADPQAYLARAREEIMALPRAQLQRLMQLFLSAAEDAWACGFQVIQLHAAHGYLLSLLCTPEINSRTDEFNAHDLEFLNALVAELARRLPEAVLDIRVSFLLGIRDHKAEAEAGYALLDRLVKMPFHVISLSNGIYNIDKNYIYPPQSASEEQYLTFAGELVQRYREKYWSIAGNLHDLGSISRAENRRLLFSFGRQMICDPEFVEKYLAHREEEIVLCTHCGRCHYFSNHENALNRGRYGGGSCMVF